MEPTSLLSPFEHFHLFSVRYYLLPRVLFFLVVIVLLFGCSLYNNIRHPSKLANGADLYYFKHNIEPKWEDPICANGGKWTMNFSREKSDKPFLYTVCNLTFI